MKLYNTLTKELTEVTPLDGKTLRIYSCGPTVYDHIHIGNLSSFIFADTLRRVAQASGLEVKHVMNFTDVDDKTIRRSHERYPELDPKETLLKLTNEYADIFLEDMDAVGNDIASYDFVKATDTIEGMQQLINELHQKGFAYIADDGVYFSIEAYRKSGKTYGQLTEITASSTSEARIQNDEYDKESAHDFALWKTRKEGEPAWEFQLDGKKLNGRPGWHIECSVMSSDNLGQPFDIHTGGVDLIFPHHENEIAQSTAGKENSVYATVFAHNEHLLVDGQKMSKSLNNFYTLKDITNKGFDPLAFRLLVLQSHYKSQAHFTWDNLEAASNLLQNIREWSDIRFQGQVSSSTVNVYVNFRTNFEQAMSDDLKTPYALSNLNGIIKATDEIALSSANVAEFTEIVDSYFGLNLLTRHDVSNEQKQLIAEREAARKSQDWQKSDKLRDQLKAQGIGLRDTDTGAIWYRLPAR